jgi:hypothetical protein
MAKGAVRTERLLMPFEQWNSPPESTRVSGYQTTGEKMPYRRIAAVVLTLVLFSIVLSPQSYAQMRTTLEKNTIEAFDGYMEHVLESVRKRERGETHFLWIDEGSPRKRIDVLSGAMVTHRFEESSKIPGGLIHDWMGVIFFPNVTNQEVLDFLTAFDQHREIYHEVVVSTVIKKKGDQIESHLRFRKKQVVEAILDAFFDVQIEVLDDRRATIKSMSTRILEVLNADTPEEKHLPEGEDSGFLWRMNTIWRLEQLDEGVLAECNTVSLSRDIPWGLRWMIGPFVKSLPRDALQETLQATRLALQRK